jgi:hypothetical protein
MKTVSCPTNNRQVDTGRHVRANMFRLDSKNLCLSLIAATNLTLWYCGRVEQQAEKDLVNRFQISSPLISVWFLLKLCSHAHQFLSVRLPEVFYCSSRLSVY